MLISPEYLEQQRELHSRGNYGISSGRWAPAIINLKQSYGCSEILDYGCGTGQLKAALGPVVREYDPCLPGKDTDPAPADMVVCTDVLEHIEPPLLDEVLSHLASKVKKVLFFTIALRPAGKFLADGRNAHLIVEPADWWHERLSKHFTIIDWNAREGHEVAGVASKASVARTGIRPNAKRRKLSKKQKQQFETFFENLRAGSDRYSDPLCAIKTFQFWEGVEDKPADVMFVIDILEHQWDVHAALKDIKALTKRCALICIRPDFRGKQYWHDTISQYFLINEDHEDRGMLSFVANQKTLIPGAKIVPAGDEQSRWENIKASTLKYTDCMKAVPPHGRRSLIACYGPSLKDTWPALKEQALDPNADVVSVSGAHDFLLEKGIVPRFHIECDPRAHKADNIARPHPDTEYLLSSMCHPKMFEKLDGAKIKLWHSSDGEVARKIVDELKSQAPIIFGGGSVGLRSIPVMYRIGYRNWAIHGMDCSVSSDGQDKWAGPHAQKENQKDHQLVTVEYNGRHFLTTAILLSYGTDFFDMMNRMLEHDPSIKLEVFGDGLLQARVNGPPSPIRVLLPEQEAA